MRAPAQEAPGTSGASQAKANFELIGWGVAENSTHDVGTDLFLMARDVRRFDLGLLLGVQVKSGPSYFDSPIYLDSGELRGWWFDADQDHWDAWLNHSIPHLIVLQDLDTKVSYWAHITREAVTSTGKRSKILVPADQTVDAAHHASLVDVATSRRPSLIWEGTAWTGAQELAAADLLRYALVVPRLVAPHPNTGSWQATPEKCLAMVVLVRLNELHAARQFGHANVPEMADAGVSTEWRWRLVAGLHAYLQDDDPQPLRVLAEEAVEPSDVAAGSVVAAAALLEWGRAAEAVELLEQVIERDVAGPVDHGWLQAQLARAYAEVGRLVDARDLALSVQVLRSEFPQDASAAAIAGASAQLVFTVSDFGEMDVAEVITASDSTAAWWRTQVLAWGLGHEADEQFVAWTGGEASEDGLNELRAVMLMSGFTADWGGWRHAASRLARHRLLPATRESPPDQVTARLATLRRSGDTQTLEAATTHLLMDGPAAAITDLARDLRLELSTRTTARADLAFLSKGGDVVAEADVDRHLDWAMATLADPKDYGERLKPPFRIEHSLLQAMQALVPAASAEMKRRLVNHVLALAGEQDQLTANGWSRVVYAIPGSVWTPADAHTAAQRAGNHQWELEYALLRIAAPHEPDVMARLLREAAADTFKAFDALDNVTRIPTENAALLSAVASKHLVDQRKEAHSGGGYGMGGVDWAWWLAAISLSHPDAADWPALLEHFNDPLAHPEHLTSAVRLIGNHASKVPAEILPQLATALDQLSNGRGPQLSGGLSRLWNRASLEQAAKWASLALQATVGQIDPTQIYSLLSGTDDDRRLATILMALQQDPTYLPALAALAFDPAVNVRFGASEALGYWAGHGIGGRQVHQLIDALLLDPGVRVSRGVIAGLGAARNRQAVVAHEHDLLDHRSASVRNGAKELMAVEGDR
jgi:hypothetical protein